MAVKHVVRLAAIMNWFNEDSKTFAKGENAVESGDVKKMEYDAELQLIHGNVHASMKNKVYNVEISLCESGFITSAQCSCPRGIKCHHIAALCLFAHYNISITDKQCTWRSTKNKSEEIVTCDDLYPKEPYCGINRKMTEDEMKEVRAQLNSLGSTVGFSWLLQPENCREEVAFLSVPLIQEIISSEDFLNTDKKKQYMQEKCMLNYDVIINVALQTTGQSLNDNWLAIRKHRLTASNFGAVLAACRRKRFPESLFKSLAGTYNLDGVKAIQWGKTHENVAITNFETATNLKVVPTGIWLSGSGILGGSPDGLVGNDALIEVKCPYSHRNDEFPEKLKTCKNYIIYFNDEGLQINKSHYYYAQIQGLLHILNRSICYLVVWSIKGHIITVINKDLTWKSNLMVLEEFYFNQYIPKVLENLM